MLRNPSVNIEIPDPVFNMFAQFEVDQAPIVDILHRNGVPRHIIGKFAVRFCEISYRNICSGREGKIGGWYDSSDKHRINIVSGKIDDMAYLDQQDASFEAIITHEIGHYIDFQ